MAVQLMDHSSRQNCWDLIKIFAAKLVLEVFGGTGAIWGFSEACGMRNSHNIWFWRPAALTVGAIFFIKWIVQILEHVKSYQVVQNEEATALMQSHNGHKSFTTPVSKSAPTSRTPETLPAPQSLFLEAPFEISMRSP